MITLFEIWFGKMVIETWRDPMGNYDDLIQEKNDGAGFRESKGHGSC